MLELKPHVRLNFNSMSTGRMLILPGDRISVRFDSDQDQYFAHTVQADINSPGLPEPFRTRYQSPHRASVLGDSGARLPCNDVMIADAMTCSNVGVWCKDENEDFTFTVHGAGELFTFRGRCGDFMKDNAFDFAANTALLHSGTQAF